jgi:hypothetical protein
MLRWIAAAMAAAFCTLAVAQQYRWVDRDGRIGYGDVPPPGAQVTRLRPPPAAPAAARKDSEKPLSPEAAFQKRQKEAREQEEKSAKGRAEAETRRVNCEQAQASLRYLQSGQRATTTTATGERVFLDDGQRGAETERAQRAVNEWCK